MSKEKKTIRNILCCILIVLIGGFLSWGVERIFEPQETKVKNVIFMIGDGMGLAQVTATQIAQDYEPLALERAHYVGLQKSYSASNRVTDSAAAGTALSTGYKTKNGMIGMTPDSLSVPSILDKAEECGMPTGVVVTYPVTNATPAAFVAHVPNRNMEDEIAMFYLENEIDVVFGGGSKRFDQRADGVNIFDTLKERNYTIAQSLSELSDINSGNVIMLPTEGSMSSRLDGRDDYLPEATAKALEILTNNADGDGFFLMVESSMIDGYGHQNNIEGIIKETKDFDNAIKVAFDYADAHPGTLVVVTADHSTGGLTIVNGNRTFDLYDHKVDYAFTTGGHTGEMVPIFAYGAGSENFTGVFENTDLPRIMCRLLGLE
jgi:alkaline phosphatase